MLLVYGLNERCYGRVFICSDIELKLELRLFCWEDIGKFLMFDGVIFFCFIFGCAFDFG